MENNQKIFKKPYVPPILQFYVYTNEDDVLTISVETGLEFDHNAWDFWG